MRSVRAYIFRRRMQWWYWRNQDALSDIAAFVVFLLFLWLLIF